MKELLQSIYARGYVTKIVDDPAILAQKLDRDYVPLKMSVYNKDGSTTNIKLENIFTPLETEHNRPVQKILIDGRAGSGKSTTLEELLHLYSTNDLRFEYVFRVRLKALQDNSWKDNYKAEDKRDNLLACFICASIMRLKKDNGVEGAIDQDKLLKDIIIALKSDKTLILVDGYEDIQHLIRHDESIKDNIIGQIIKTKINHVVMTARSNSIDSLTKNHFDRKVGLEGLDNKGTKSYVEKFFSNLKDILTEEVNKYFTEYLVESKMGDEDPLSLLKYLQDSANKQTNGAYHHLNKVLDENDTEQDAIIAKINGHYDSKKLQLLNVLSRDKAVKELASTPMNAAILCVVFSDKEIDANHSLTLEKLYSKLIEWLATRFEYQSTESRVGNVLKALQEIAYKSLDKEKLPHEVIVEVLEKYQLSIDVINQFGVIKIIRGEVPAKMVTGHGMVISERAGEAIERTSALSLLKRPEHQSQYFNARQNEDLHNKNFEFIHKSVLEYLAACEFAFLLSHPDKGDKKAKEAAEFIASHRYEAKYLMFIKFITGMLINSDSDIGIKRLFEALTCNIDGELKLGIDSDVKLLTHVLSQSWVTNENNDKVLDPRIPNLDKIVSIIDHVVTTKLSTVSRMITDSSYISPDIIAFLFSQIDNRKIEPNIVSRQYFTEEKFDELQLDDIVISGAVDSNHADIETSTPSSQDSEYEESYSPGKRSKYTSMTDPDVVPVILSIKTIAGLLDKLDADLVFTKLLTVLRPLEAWQVKKMSIHTLAKILETQQVDQELLNRFKNILVSNAVSHKMLSNVVKHALKIINAEDPIILRSESFPEIGLPDIEVPNELKVELLGLSLDKVIQRLKTTEINKVYIIKILIENLESNWLENTKLQRMSGLLNLLNYSSDDSNEVEVSGLRSLAEFTKKLLQIQIADMNDNSDIEWFNSHFHSLTKNLTPRVIELVFLHIISDGKFAPDEVAFVKLCITQLGFSIIVGEPEIRCSLQNGTEYRNFITYNGIKYILFGKENHFAIKGMLEDLQKETIVNLESVLKEMKHSVEESKEGEVAVIMKNTGSGIKIAASDILKSHSIITEQGISANNKALVSFLYYTDHKKSEPNDVFVVVELKDPIFGKHFAYKIFVNSHGEVDVYEYFAHPDEVGSMAIKILGAMQYTEVKPKYCTSSFEVDINVASPLIEKAPGYRSEVKSSGKSLMEKSVTFVRRSHDQQIQNESLKIGNKAKLLHNLLDEFVSEFSRHNIAGEWSLDGVSSAFVERGRQLIGIIDTNYQDSFRIDQKDMKNWQKQADALIKELDIKTLVKLIDKDHQSKKAQKEMDDIESNPYKYELYKGIVQAMNSVYIAAQAINTEMVQSVSDGNLALTGGVLNKVAEYVPFGLGAAVGFIGDIFNAADDIEQSHNIENYMEFALNSAMMSKISDKVARKFIALGIEDIREGVLGALASTGKAVHNIVKKGPAAAIVNLCVALKGTATESNTEEDLQKRLGKEHAKIVSKIIIDSIFRGEYDKTYARELEGKASDIIKFVVKKISENVRHKVSSLDQHDTGASGKSIGDNDGEEKDPEDITGSNKEDDESFVRDSESAILPPKNLGCTGGHCVVMAVHGMEYDNFLLQTQEGRELLEYTRKFHGINAFNQMFEIGKDEESTKIILKYAEELNIKVTLDDNWQKLVKAAEILYGAEAAKALIESSSDSEYTEGLLEEAKLPGGIEKVLKTLFGATSETAIKNFEAIIAVEDDRTQSGLLQYLWSAAAGNKHAQKLIDDINYLYTKVQELIIAGKDFGTEFLQIKYDLGYLLDIAESGQILPVYYHPGGPGDDYDGDGAGGGSGGLFFEGGGDNQDMALTIYPVVGASNVTIRVKPKVLEDDDLSM